jgi:uncharacterized membrane protein YedE/YeeE
MHPVFGGILIGSAASILLLFNGRISGISGIFGTLLKSGEEDKGWRFLFIAGLVVGGILLQFFRPEVFQVEVKTSFIDLAVAGFVVGFGALMGHGCTSGHGVCGLSRFSKRSFAATGTFMLFAMISVVVFKLLRGPL